MTYEQALLITAAFYALLSAGATWLCVLAFDPLMPIRRDRKTRRYFVIGFALVCFLVGYGIANAEIVEGTLVSHFRPAACEPQEDMSYCTADLQAFWVQQVASLRKMFWEWTLVPPITRPLCTVVSIHVCQIVNNRAYGDPNGWFITVLMRGSAMSATALIIGWMLTRSPKPQLTQEQEAVLSLIPSKMRKATAERMLR